MPEFLIALDDSSFPSFDLFAIRAEEVDEP